MANLIANCDEKSHKKLVCGENIVQSRKLSNVNSDYVVSRTYQRSKEHYKSIFFSLGTTRSNHLYMRQSTREKPRPKRFKVTSGAR